MYSPFFVGKNYCVRGISERISHGFYGFTRIYADFGFDLKSAFKSA